MKILMAHNYYQKTGGEDISFKAEAELLEKNGQVVLRYTRDNDEIKDYGFLGKMRLPVDTIWSRSTLRDFETILQKEKPDLVHFQNTFPLISPSTFYACKRLDVPVIMNLNNYRLLCVNGLFLRDLQICEDCINRVFAWPGVRHACYRDSKLQSAAVASMTAFHRIIHTWNDKVDAYICHSEFSRNKFIQGGIPAKKIRVKPNVVEDPGENKEKGEYALFVGRLSPEKGIQVLMESIKKNPGIPFVIVGSGPLEEEVRRAGEDSKNVTYLGELEHNQIMEVLKRARFLIYPSECYETFGRVIVEAFSCGIPAIISKIGAIQELVQDGATGLFCSPGDAEDLAEKCRWLWEHPDDGLMMGINARKEYLKRYTPEVSYQAMMNIYSEVLEKSE